ncbi:ESCRT-II complex subunit [Hirsutella rhossiliensis]|uniref:Vacuolar protein-sorting-associated protein 25 n=1 Tax=Hirsutella rhossiliensis TaxID=111463 RepID=A0A9P8MPK9_9HYPO|nr:ESCRT-II complex subunit domain-containing protein [Hirsutella rhossiliensis]KAH0958809.1 ESCRT-II complex subunit domain-containing protein [Hirsutella rhossiliensis]
MASTAPAPAPAGEDAASSPPFPFPREYHFPAFFTRQTNLTTHHAQLSKWSALVLAYARHHRLFRLHLSAAADSDLFRNRRIDRRLSPADIRDLLDFMRRDGRAEYLDAKDSGDVVFVHWRKPDEWAAVVEAYIEDSSQKDSVLTLYELTDGEATRGTELHGMDSQVLLKALNILVKRGKAQIFGQEDSLGVKFF